jgi:signal transduction histidine kinase
MFPILTLGSAALMLVVALGALQKRPDPLAKPLALLMFAAAFWATLDGISMGFAAHDRVLFWYRLKYPGFVMTPVMYAIFALKYGGYERWLSRRTYALLAVVPVLTVALIWTNPYHGLYWESVWVTSVYNASVVGTDRGPWFWVSLGYLYLHGVTAIGILGSFAIRSGHMYRKQAGVLFAGGLVPLVTNAIYVFDIGPLLMIDLTTTALAVTGLLFGLGLYYFDLVEVQPVARDRLLEDLDDGVVVVGPDGRIREFNPTAATIFEDLSVNAPADEVFDTDVTQDGGEIAVETDAGKRMYHARTTPLQSERTEDSGMVVYLNDVTEIVKREQRVGVLNRVLRHNIRNELNVAVGHLDILERTLSSDDLQHVEITREAVDRVLTIAGKARDVERTLQDNSTSVTTSATATVDRVVTAMAERYPDADITRDYSGIEAADGAGPTDGGGAADEAGAADGGGAADEAGPADGGGTGPPAVPVEVVEENLLEIALTELVENAIEHNRQNSPEVTVRVESGEEVNIRVIDDGPSIPDMEKAVLQSRGETELEHGSGLGLWLVQWTARLSSGDLSFRDLDPRGNVVTFTLPAAEE